ncbi:MAG: hypothetical protein COB53_04415 [Elusimicrobia bacterium]|nr:MAG: hypothetical protein COB53_04415 [Elusimicrobiota bacterium]
MRSLWLIAALAATASGAPVKSVWTWDAPVESVLIGAPILLEANVDIPEGYSLMPHLKDQSKGAFEILGVASDGGRVRIKTAAFALGKQSLPALRWTLRNAAGKLSEIESPPLAVTINPPTPKKGESGDLRSIKQPLEARLWPLLLAIALLFLMIGAIGYWYEKQRKRGKTIKSAKAIDSRTPEEIAFEELDALADLSLPVKEYYDRLSDVLRAYLERRLAIPALTMTTHDLRRALLRAETEPKSRQAIKSLLDQCDLAKFARHLPTEEQSTRAREDAKKIVQRLTPKPVPVPGGAA